MRYGAFELNLNDLAMAAVTLWGAISYWRIRRAKAQALIAQKHPEEVDTTPPPSQTTNQGGTNDQAP